MSNFISEASFHLPSINYGSDYVANERSYKETAEANEIYTKIEESEDASYQDIIPKGDVDIIKAEKLTEEEKDYYRLTIALSRKQF